MLDAEHCDHQPPDEELVAARREIEGLREALETRHTIGLAQGILMARHALTVSQSFDYLKRRSQGDNIKLREIAGHVVAELDAGHPVSVNGAAVGADGHGTAGPPGATWPRRAGPG